MKHIGDIMQGNTQSVGHRTLLVEGRYRLLLDAITDYAIYMLDPQGHVSSWNSGAQRFKGFTEDEIIGKNFSQFYTPEDRAAGLPQIALKRAQMEGRFESEGWRVRKDGRRFWAHVIIDPIRSAKGGILGYAKITRDLTERKQAEAELKQSEEQFRLLVNGVTDYAIYMLDPSGIVSSWNHGAQRIKGYDREEIIGQHFSRFYTPEDLEIGKPATALETASRHGRFDTEGWRLRKDGSRFWASVVIDAIHGDDGEVIGFAKITRDITEKRSQQQALTQAREELFQAQKMEAVGQLTGGIAHDFNNLLMAVLGSLELLRKRIPPTPETDVLISNAIEGANRGAALTQRMLAFSRKQDLKIEEVDILGLVHGMSGLLTRSLGPSAQIDMRVPLTLPPVRSDPNQLASALLNLTVNARDAMAGLPGTEDAKAIVIAATVAGPQQTLPAGLADGNYVCLSVTDQGTGMDAETLEKAPAPFFTTKGIGKGTGLGLSMVQGLMEQSGGKLVLHSQPGRGTRAELWLPVSAGVVAGPAQDNAAPQPVETAPRRRRILVVDDDTLVLMNTVLMLEDLGHDVQEATSGTDALKIIEADPSLDLVVTDHAMPKMTGADLIEALRQMRPALPVVLASGFAELPASLGPCLRLSKPFTQAQLSSIVEKVMSQGCEQS